MSKLNVDQKTIIDLLSDKKADFLIPDYQRPYAWTTEQARDLYPFLELHDLQGALWDPLDGDIDPSQLTQAFAKGARDKGARVRRFGL